MSKRKGQRGFVFEVSAACMAMAQADRDIGPLFVSFCRGRRRTTSEGTHVDGDGRAEFVEPLEGMMVTLYKDKKKPEFESKEYKFKLREAGPDGLIRTVAVVAVDMAQYLTPQATSCPTLQLVMDVDGVDTAALMVDLSWGFVKEGKPEDDDVMSSQSAEDEIEDTPEEIDASLRMPDVLDVLDDDDDDDDDDDGSVQDTTGFVQMSFSVFLQEEGEEDLAVSGLPDWNLMQVRSAVSDEMDGRGLWVFMSDGAPIDPEEEDGVPARELDLLQGQGDEQEDEDEDFSDLMDEEVLEELIQSKKAERRALRELESVKRMLDGAEEDGGMMGVMRQEMDQMKHELTDLQSSSETELATKTAEWQQAMDIGQDLLEKTRDLQDQLDDAHDLTEQLKVQLDPMETELAQLKDMIVDHEENAALIEEERQGMEEQRYRISELEGLRDLLEQELRDKEEAFEVRLQDELEQQKDSLEQKFQSELAWEQQKTERALEEAAAVAQDSQQQEASDVEKLKTQIAELQTLVDTTNRSLAMEQSFASAHKNEIKKGQVALAEAKREKKDTVEKIKAKDSQFKKLQGTKDDSDKLAQAKTQEVQSLKKEMMVIRRDLSASAAELEEAAKTTLELERKLEATGGSSEALTAQGGLMDMSGMADMQAAIGAEYKVKYEAAIGAQKDKIKLLQAKNAQMHKKHEAEIMAAEKKGASVAMTKMAKAMKQAKKQQQKEAAKAQQKAEKKHQKELRRAKAMALAQGDAAQKLQKDVVQEGWLQKKGSKGIGRKGGKGWSWRWFIYRPKEHQLLYYEKDGPKMELKGTIEMKDAKRVYVLDNKDQDKARQSFGVELPKRTYLLQAGDRKQMSKWVDFLNTACKKWDGSLPAGVGQSAGAAGEVAEGIPPDDADAALQAAAVTRRSKELAAKIAHASSVDPLDAKRASALSDQQVGYGNAALKTKAFAKAAEAARLALELDAENMEASSLLKKAEQALKAATQGSAPGTAGGGGVPDPEPALEQRPAAKPLQSTRGMFDDEDEDEDDMFGD